MMTKISRWAMWGIAVFTAACSGSNDVPKATNNANNATNNQSTTSTSGTNSATNGSTNTATTNTTAATTNGTSGQTTGTNGTNGTNGTTGSTNGTTGDHWMPTPGTTWQWQLTDAIDTTVDVQMYDIDLFDNDAATIQGLHDDGRIVICYFSAGTYENWRPDKASFTAADYGNELADWPGEFWLDTNSANVRQIMMTRLDMAAQKGCDGVEPDNVDGYANDNGLGLQEADQLDYNQFLAAQAHGRGLSVGLKNSVDLVGALEPDFDWALNEECYQYDECNTLQPFLAANKAVFHTEYVNRQNQGSNRVNQVCGNVPAGFSTIIKLWDLNAWVLPCP